MAEINPEKERMRSGGKFWGWLVVVLAGGILVAAIALPNFVPMGGCSRCENACINNLRQIDGAKQTWALEHKASSNAAPTWADVQPYLGRGTAGEIPKCPQGGHYTLGSVQEAPTCSIPGHALE